MDAYKKKGQGWGSKERKTTGRTKKAAFKNDARREVEEETWPHSFILIDGKQFWLDPVEQAENSVLEAEMGTIDPSCDGCGEDIAQTGHFPFCYPNGDVIECTHCGTKYFVQRLGQPIKPNQVHLLEEEKKSMTDNEMDDILAYFYEHDA